MNAYPAITNNIRASLHLIIYNLFFLTDITFDCLQRKCTAVQDFIFLGRSPLTAGTSFQLFSGGAMHFSRHKTVRERLRMCICLRMHTHACAHYWAPHSMLKDYLFYRYNINKILVILCTKKKYNPISKLIISCIIENDYIPFVNE